MYCANHPGVETYLRCAKCEKPICAKCRVSTPVGFRCFDCARLDVLPTYAISTDYYLKAIAGGFVAAAVGGVLMGLLPAFEFWAALLLGIAVPEAVAFAANQKRGPGLQAVAMVAVVFGFALSRVVMHTFSLHLTVNLFFFLRESPIPGLGAAPFYVSQYTVLWIALALFLAHRRLR